MKDKARRSLIAKVDHILAEEYAEVEWRPSMDPMSELVLTILSQHTSDLNSEKAFAKLWARFGSWEAVMKAPVKSVEDSIRSGGLAGQKAPRIQEVLYEVLAKRGELNITFLQSLSLEDGKAWLRALPGVGPKTAAVVLCFALGQPAFPVDTHVYRVTRRLGLIDRQTSVDSAHEVLEGATEPGRVYSLHRSLITHGRRVCSARYPRCGECVLSDICPSAERGA